MLPNTVNPGSPSVPAPWIREIGFAALAVALAGLVTGVALAPPALALYRVIIASLA